MIDDLYVDLIGTLWRWNADKPWRQAELYPPGSTLYDDRIEFNTLTFLIVDVIDRDDSMNDMRKMLVLPENDVCLYETYFSLEWGHILSRLT